MEFMAGKAQSQEELQSVLKNVVVSRVQPSSISDHPEFLYPSVYDMVCVDIYVANIFLYRLDSADPWAFTNFLRGVKSSLSKVLSLYYPLAGKWIVTEEPWIRKLLCDDEGAVFVEAALDEEMDKVFDRTDPNIPDELTGEHAVPGLDSKAIHKSPETKELPSSIVQVTRFKCGGVALTLNFNHMTLDGYSFDRFLKAWSEIATTGQTSSKPIFDRSTVVSHLEKGDILGIPPEVKNVDDNLSRYFKPFTSSRFADIASKFFSVRKDVADRLKLKAKEFEESGFDMPDQERPERFSTFECITGQLWRCFARIPELLPGMSSEEKVVFLFPVEGRKKWSNPSVPDDYFGNLYMLAGPPELPASEVSSRTLSFAAIHIHKAVRTLNHATSGKALDHMLTVMRELKLTEEKLESKSPNSQTSNVQVYLTSWSRFGSFYDLDFGYGAPFSVIPWETWNDSATVSILHLPLAPGSENAIEMLIRAPLKIFEILFQDQEFVDLVT